YGCYVGLGATCEVDPNWEQQNKAADEQAVLADLRSRGIRTKPLFELKRVIDELTLIINHRRGLTERSHTNPVFPRASLCLDTWWGNLGAGVNTMLGDCNGSSGQKWIYDRKTDSIKNVATGLCLSVGQALATPGTPAGLWYCTGQYYQQWTYDIETHV